MSSSTISVSIQAVLEKIKLQELDNSQFLNLNANENQMSNTARSVLSSALADRYNLGAFDDHKYAEVVTIVDFVFKGLKHIYELEKMAVDAVSQMFGSMHSEFRLLSGIHGMFSSLISLTEVGDTVYSLDYNMGGHFATHFIVKQTGRVPGTIPIDPKTLSIDIDKFAKKIVNEPAKMVYLDMGCPLFSVPIKELREVVGPETIIIYDGSHTLGLIAGGKFQDPLGEGADIVQGNTHKTFPGPQKAMINFKSIEYAKKLADALNAGLVSNRHNHHDLALFITIFEMQEFGKAYAEQMLLNAQSLVKALSRFDIEILGNDAGYTNSHVLLIKGDSVGGYIDACHKLIQSNISANSRYGFGEEIIRLGVQEVTRRGMKEDDMQTVAYFFKKLLKDGISSEKVREEVREFNGQFSHIDFSFDQLLS